jgi:hypothetical protein
LKDDPKNLLGVCQKGSIKELCIVSYITDIKRCENVVRLIQLAMVIITAANYCAETRGGNP